MTTYFNTMFFVLAVLLVPLSLSAKRSSGMSDKLVRISQKNSKVELTGFIAEYQEKVVVICNSKAFGVGTEIKDSNGKKLQISEILVPAKKEKRTILILIMAENDSGRSAFEIDTDIVKNNKKGDAVSVRGYSLSKQKLFSGKGKIEDIQDRKILVDSNVRRNITGAPVISLKSGKVIGVAKCIRKKKIEMPYAERIDNIANFAKITSAQADKEEKEVTELESSVVTYGKTYLKLNKTIENSGYSKKTTFKHLSDTTREQLKQEIQKIYDELKTITKELSRRFKDGQKRDEMIIPSFKSAFRANLLRAEEIIERKCKPREELFEKIMQELDKGF